MANLVMGPVMAHDKISVVIKEIFEIETALFELLHVSAMRSGALGVGLTSVILALVLVESSSAHKGKFARYTRPASSLVSTIRLDPRAAQPSLRLKSRRCLMMYLLAGTMYLLTGMAAMLQSAADSRTATHAICVHDRRPSTFLDLGRRSLTGWMFSVCAWLDVLSVPATGGRACQCRTTRRQYAAGMLWESTARAGSRPTIPRGECR